MYKYKSLQAGQLPPEQLNFITSKYLKQEVHDDLSASWMNGAPVASLRLETKIYQCHVIKR